MKGKSKPTDADPQIEVVSSQQKKTKRNRLNRNELSYRLSELKEQIDDVSVEDEYHFLVNLWLSDEFRDEDNDNEHTTTLLQQYHTRFGISKAMLEPSSNDEYERYLVIKMITNTRLRAAALYKELQKIKNQERKEIRLMKRFVADLQGGYKQKIASRHVFGKEEIHENAILLLHYISVVMLPVYIIGALFYVFLFGISLGQSMTIVWIQALALSILQTVFIINPLIIWAQFIGMSSLVKDDMKDIVALVRSRVRGDAAGAVLLHHDAFTSEEEYAYSPHALIQHFNAACRVARTCPDLLVSQLIVTLTDEDLPLTLIIKEKESRNSFHIINTLLMLLGLFLVVVGKLPDSIQEMLFGVIFSLGINFACFGAFFVKSKDIVLPVIAGLLIVTVFGIRQYIIRQDKKIHMPWIITNSPDKNNNDNDNSNNNNKSNSNNNSNKSKNSNKKDSSDNDYVTSINDFYYY